MSGEQVIKCRCDRRHPAGTEWCPCGAYLPHDGELIDAPAADTPAPTAAPETAAEPAGTGTSPIGLVGGADTGPIPPAPTPPLEPAAAFEPTEAVEPAVSQVNRGEKMIREASLPQPAAAFEPGLQTAKQDDGSAFGRVARADDLICFDCHLRNDAGRVFCARCGHRLANETLDEQEQRFSWWQKLVARVKGQDLKAQAMNARYQVRRVKGLSTRARMFRTAALGGLLGAVGIGFVPGLRGPVTAQIKNVSLPDRYSFVEVESLSTNAPTVAGWEVEYLMDGAENRAWATEWTAEGAGFSDPGEVSLCFPQFPTVRIHLTKESDVDLLRIWAGTWEGNAARTLQPRPRVVQIRNVDAAGESETCTFAELKDEAGPQVVDIDAKDSLAVDVSIVSVFEGDGSSNLLAVSELWVEKDR